jgi:elongation factor G
MSATPPILWMPIFAVTAADRRLLPEALAAIGRGDPAVLNRRDPATDELLYSGTSVDHLNQTFRRIFDEMQIPSWTGQPRVRFTEAITRTSEGEGKYIRQTGGSGNYGHVKLQLDPASPGSGIIFASTVDAAVIPAEYLAPIEEGFREAAQGGILAGHEMTDLRVTLFDGSFHEADSNPMAFRIAALLAFQDAARRANPVMLEPIMNAVFTVPEATLGATLAEISARRGRIANTSSVRGVAILQALVPMSEMLRGMDPAPKVMQFEGFEPVQPGRDDADPAGSAVRDPWGPKPLTGSAAADPDADWT